MSIKSELQGLSHDEEVLMFELSGYNRANLDETFYFSNAYNVNFGGIPYVPLSCEIDEISYSSEGALPRPKIRISDADKNNSRILSSLIYFYGGLEGSNITIRRTLRRFLDDGIEPNQTQEKPRDIFKISQKVQEIPGKFFEYELSAVIDFVDEVIGRPAIRSCPFIYKNAASGCPYTGQRGFFTIRDIRTLNPNEDVCSKSIDGCKARFGRNAQLPFGGFPGLQRY